MLPNTTFPRGPGGTLTVPMAYLFVVRIPGPPQQFALGGPSRPLLDPASLFYLT